MTPIRTRSLKRMKGLSAALGTLAATSVLAAPVPVSTSPIAFNRDVRPILSENCFFCHGPDKSHRKGGLRLDVRESAIELGAIVEGKPEESEIVKRIVATDPDDIMPPPATHKKVTAEQMNVLRRWIAGGAEYQPHWAFVPVRRPPVPRPKTTSWVRNSIDAFVMVALEERGITPSPPADERKLLRRLALDLVGLPPTPGELGAFVEDRAAGAWNKQVDRLLGSPHFGERMAVPWLDVARFADTVGYHGDQNQNIFPYRDYVIQSFNRNKPFDTFTIEQLAGDLLPSRGTESLVATGFNRLSLMTREGGIQGKDYLNRYMADRVRAVGTVWMGLTMGCAECHDHKYDPITARDFYSMGAFFADIKEWGLYHDLRYSPNPDLAGWTDEHPFPPEALVDSAYLRKRSGWLRAEQTRVLSAAEKTLYAGVEKRRRFVEWARDSLRFLASHGDGWEPLREVKAVGDGLDAQVMNDGTIVVSTSKKAASVNIRFSPKSPLAALRLVLFSQPGNEVGKKRPEKAKIPPFELLVVRQEGERETSLPLFHADARDKETHYLLGRRRAGVTTGWKVRVGQNPRTAVWEMAEPLLPKPNESLTVRIKGQGPFSFRLATSPFASFGALRAPSPLPPSGGSKHVSPLVAFLRTELGPAASGKRAPRGLNEIYLFSTHGARESAQRLRDLGREQIEIGNAKTPTMITVAVPSRTIRILPRGNWQDESGDVVSPATPHFLPGAKTDTTGPRLNRLDLARWLVARENPLTARVFVNRLWKQFFGTALSAVLNDLGAQGESPTHPELLDWLAAEFMESGWNVKHIVRLIVTSNAYRQDSRARLDLAVADPGNRLLARQLPRRLDAEFVRDNALFVSGAIDLGIGGPSVFPYQPMGHFDNLQFPVRDWFAEKDERQHRRGLYIHWQRTFLHPMLANFDAPSREDCTADRPPSNTPQQALTLLNDPTFVEAARVFAAGLLAEVPSDDGVRLRHAFERATGRLPTQTETSELTGLLALLRTHYHANPNDARALVGIGIHPSGFKDVAELAAWTSICRTILNLYETITKL